MDPWRHYPSDSAVVGTRLTCRGTECSYRQPLRFSRKHHCLTGWRDGNDDTAFSGSAGPSG